MGQSYFLCSSVFETVYSYFTEFTVFAMCGKTIFCGLSLVLVKPVSDTLDHSSTLVLSVGTALLCFLQGHASYYFIACFMVSVQ